MAKKLETVDHFSRLTKPNKNWLMKQKSKDRSMNDVLNDLIDQARKKKK